jgi:hypothetical protein
MRRTSLFVAVLVVMCQALSLGAGRPPGGDPTLGERIAKGVVFDGRLWLRGTMSSHNDASGALVSFGMESNSRKVHFENGVFDVVRSNHDLWVLRRGSEKNHITISQWHNLTFDDIAEFESSDKDDPIALLVSNGTIFVLSPHRIREFARETKTWRVTDLRGKLRGGVQVSLAAPDAYDSIYVGFDEGEWGGGLQQINLANGLVTDIERRDSKKICDGPLNSDCDPVTGVIRDPRNKDCVLASVGLLHLSMAHGRILRVCGQQVTVVSEMPLPTSSEKWKLTEPFYGLAPAVDDGFWGITSRALYHFKPDGTKEKAYPLPKLKRVSGIYLSRELPGAIVLMTDVNWAVSTSGYTPLVIPLPAMNP